MRRSKVLLAVGAGCVLASSLARAQGAKPAAAPRADEKSRSEPFAVATAKLPKFPELPPPTELEGGIQLRDVTLAWERGPSRLWIYLPPGDAPKASLPCVFVAPAGSNLLFGMDLGDDDREEHLPYVKAGFAVVAYEIEGVCPPEKGRTPEATWAAARRFQASFAGLQDARAALEYALAKLPSVDPKRLFAAGHSSAATMALLFAEHEPRLKGCAAYAPIDDVRRRIGDENVAEFERNLPGIGDFLVKSSPRTHEARLSCPVFLFHAEDDQVVPFADAKAFAERLRAARKDLVFETVPTGDHHPSMIEVGIPKAIEWMKKLCAAGPAKPDPKPAKTKAGN